MLHSVGCSQPSAFVFLKNWNKPNVAKCVHGFIDANNGNVYQTLPWNYRGWHCGGAGNNNLVGVEMCESAYIKYTGANKFEILDKAKAQADCKRAYDSAVELFAQLAIKLGWDPATDILSHKEGYARGIATNHGDPEHYWKGLGMSYTMDGFRADVAKKMKAKEMPFTDVQEGSWYYDSVKRNYQRGLVAGKTPTTFCPSETCTRAEVSVMLDRLATLLGK
jgi:hypothetical protein